MPTTFGSSFRDRDDRLATAGQDWYADRDRQPPEAFRQCHPLVLADAWKRSGGNWRKCEVTDDGALIVHHGIIW